MLKKQKKTLVPLPGCQLREEPLSLEEVNEVLKGCERDDWLALQYTTADRPFAFRYCYTRGENIVGFRLKTGCKLNMITVNKNEVSLLQKAR